MIQMQGNRHSHISRRGFPNGGNIFESVNLVAIADVRQRPVADLNDRGRLFRLSGKNDRLGLFQRIRVKGTYRPAFLLSSTNPGHYILKSHATSSGFKMIF